MNQTYDIQQIVSQELSGSGESVVWSGQPNPTRFAMQRLPIFIFSIPWTAFAVFWVYAASGFQFPPDFSNGGFAFFPLFGVPFVLVGLGLMLSPVYAYINAFKTIYIVTDKSIRILKNGGTKKVEIYTASDIEKIERKEKSDGSGNIIFSHNTSFTSKGNIQRTPIGLYGIPDVRTVEQYITAIRRSAE